MCRVQLAAACRLGKRPNRGRARSLTWDLVHAGPLRAIRVRSPSARRRPTADQLRLMRETRRHRPTVEPLLPCYGLLRCPAWRVRCRCAPAREHRVRRSAEVVRPPLALGLLRSALECPHRLVAVLRSLRRPAREHREVVQVRTVPRLAHRSLGLAPARRVARLRCRPAGFRRSRGAVGCAAHRRPQRTNQQPRRRSPLLTGQHVQRRATRGRQGSQPALQRRLEDGTRE